MELVIRQATNADAACIATLICAIHAIHVDGKPDIFKPMQVSSALLEETANRLAAPENVYLIAEVNTEPVGYVFAYMRDRPADNYTYAMKYIVVDQLSVNPEHRSKGYGETLLQQVYDWAGQHDVRRVTLDVWAFNDRAVAFYERLGFKPFVHRMEIEL